MAVKSEEEQPRARRYGLAENGKDADRYAIDLSGLGLDTIEETGGGIPDRLHGDTERPGA
mgnify:CR=1 FL=1